MAEAAVASAPSAGAAVATETAGAGTGASPTTGSAALTDEQILGIGTEETPTEGAQVVKPETEESGAGEKQDETKPAGEEEPAAKPNDTTARGLTPEVREFFKAHPEVRDAYYRAEQYSKLFPDFKTAEQMAGYLEQYESPAELAEALGGARDLAAIDRMFFSGDPGEQGRIIENLLTESPEEAAQLIDAIAPTLARLAESKNPALAKMAQEKRLDARTEAFRDAMDLAHRKATSEQDQEMLDALDLVANKLLGRTPWSPEEREARLSRLERQQQEIEERRQQARVEEGQRWIGEANNLAVQEFLGAARDTVTQLVGKTYSTEAQRLLVGEIYRRVSDSLERDQDLVDHVQALARGGMGDPKVQRQIVRLVTNQAKRMVPGVAEKVVGAFGAGTLAATQQRQRTDQRAASRVDVTGTAGMGAGAKKTPSVEDLRKGGRYRQLSDDDIIEGRF